MANTMENVTLSNTNIMENMFKFVEISPTLCDCVTGIREALRADDKCNVLSSQLQLVESRERDMTVQWKAVEANDPCMTKKQTVEHYFVRVKGFKTKANETLKKFITASRWKRTWMNVKGDLDEILKDGYFLLTMADQLHNEGLMLQEICTRGVKLPVEELIGKTAKGLRRDVLNCIKTGTDVIGIHGNFGAGKTNLLKWVHNDVCDEPNLFKAVLWAGAPEGQSDAKSIQDCIAEAMRFELKDRDVVRRGGMLAKRLKDLGPGHVVLFLDNLKEQFQVHDVGLPVGANEAENFWCTLVFTATSENICNRMRCSATAKFKMDLLQENEARELFLYEAGWSNRCTRSYNRRIQHIADDVAKQCARMPLVITLIARSMTGKDDIYEWKNKLDELMGTVENMHGDEAKILEQLKFSFDCLKNDCIKRCFLASATVLTEGQHRPREELIQCWMSERLIGKKSRSGTIGEASYNQGHTIINELHRVYLLEITEVNGTKCVSMNKWIRKMAECINDSRSQTGNCSARGKKRNLPPRACWG